MINIIFALLLHTIILYVFSFILFLIFDFVGGRKLVIKENLYWAIFPTIITIIIKIIEYSIKYFFG